MAIKHINAFLVNAFTKMGRGGNPAGVVLNADDLEEGQKQTIAKRLGLSETAFVSERRSINRNNSADFDVSFYTPTQEVDFCGHATLAAFTCLLDQGIIACGKYVQSTKVGELEVWVGEGGLVTMSQSKASFHERFQWREILPLLNLPSNQKMLTNLPIEVVSTGLKDCIIPLPKGVLDNLKFDLPSISDFCKQYDLVGFHLFELEINKGESILPSIKAQCRNIAPAVGIDEESATGSSSGALACYLNKYLGGNPTEFEFEQGRQMGCLSSLVVKLTAIQGVHEPKTDQVSITSDDVNYKINVSGFSQLMGQELTYYEA